MTTQDAAPVSRQTLTMASVGSAAVTAPVPAAVRAANDRGRYSIVASSDRGRYSK